MHNSNYHKVKIDNTELKSHKALRGNQPTARPLKLETFLAQQVENTCLKSKVCRIPFNLIGSPYNDITIGYTPCLASN